MHILNTIIVSFSLFLCGELHAAGAYRARDLIQLAIQRNPELKALKFESEARLNFASQSSRWENPNLELGAEWKDQPIGKTDLTKVGISQQIPRPGRLKAKTNAANARSKLAAIQQQLSELQLRHEVLRLIYEYRAAAEKAVHAQERLDRFKTIGTYLRSQVFAAPQKRAEASIVRTKLLILGREFRELEAERKIAWNKLNLYLGLTSEPKMDTPWFKSGDSFKIDDLTAKAQANSPILQRQEMSLKDVESQLQLARTESWQGITLNAGYASGSGVDPEKVYGLGVSFPLPILNLNSGNIRGLDHQLDAERERSNWARQRLNQEIKAAFEHYDAARVSVQELKIDDLPKFEKEMKAIDQGFKKGQVDLLTYIEADAEHFETLNAMLDSQIDFIGARSALYELIGQPSPEAE
jgi:outer membrane protein TolC